MTFAVLFSSLFHQNLPAVWAELSLPFHEACLSLSPTSDHKVLYEAMVCGADPQSPETERAFAMTGLLHLLVVSGSHLVALEIGLKWFLSFFARMRPIVGDKWTDLKIAGLEFHLPRCAALTLLTLFVLSANGAPPITRSWVYWMLRMVSANLGLQWSSVQTATISGFVSFALCWRGSGDDAALRSLLLSWMAALAVHGFSTEASRNRHGAFGTLLMHLKIYLLLAPALLPLAVPHPISVLINWLVGPLLGGFLFPVSLLAFLLPPLTALIDILWDASLACLKELAHHTPQGLSPIPSPLWAQLLYLALLSLAAMAFERVRAPSRQRAQP